MKLNQLVKFIVHQLSLSRLLLVVYIASLGMVLASVPAEAAEKSYVERYLANEPVELELDKQGNTRSVTPKELTQGKELFENNCLNCHVGGTTLPDPSVSLSLEDLAGATPPRDSINALVTFLRDPMTYDGNDYSFWCRQVPESWMPQEQVEKLAAFVLRAAQKAPGWGADEL
ncbi:MAG: photosystem II cytochrome PsbV2 [Cyanobacteria bacterium QS_1_48_34]|nr:MAG: photosystem II cytochrome PsbV2 [Cyanobacteria bacterium QS_1_48_34]